MKFEQYLTLLESKLGDRLKANRRHFLTIERLEEIIKKSNIPENHKSRYYNILERDENTAYYSHEHIPQYIEYFDSIYNSLNRTIKDKFQNEWIIYDWAAFIKEHKEKKNVYDRWKQHYELAKKLDDQGLADLIKVTKDYFIVVPLCYAASYQLAEFPKQEFFSWCVGSHQGHWKSYMYDKHSIFYFIFAKDIVENYYEKNVWNKTAVQVQSNGEKIYWNSQDKSSKIFHLKGIDTDIFVPLLKYKHAEQIADISHEQDFALWVYKTTNRKKFREHYMTIEHDETRLLYATQNGDLEAIKEIDIKNSINSKIIHEAIENNHLEILKYFAKFVNEVFYDEFVMHAISEANLDIVKYLLSDARPEQYNEKFELELIKHSIRNWKFEVFKYLLQRFNYKDAGEIYYQVKGMLSEYTLNKTDSTIDFFKKYLVPEYNFEQEPWEEWKVLELFQRSVKYNANRQLIKMFLENYKIDVSYDSWSVVSNAILSDNTDMINYCISKGYNLEENKNRLFVFACTAQSKDCIKYLLDKGADIHSENDKGLYQCLRNGDEESTELLMKRGADIHANNDWIIKDFIEKRRTYIIRFIYQEVITKEDISQEILDFAEAYNKISDSIVGQEISQYLKFIHQERSGVINDNKI